MRRPGTVHVWPGSRVILPGLPYAIGIQHAFPGRQVIAFADYAAFATANGALGIKVTEPGDLRGAVQLALNQRRICTCRAGGGSGNHGATVDGRRHPARPAGSPARAGGRPA
jgi:thiamine pyrophosphate-dependent acetolactate synthase large subunit-like protein